MEAEQALSVPQGDSGPAGWARDAAPSSQGQAGRGSPGLGRENKGKR